MRFILAVLLLLSAPALAQNAAVDGQGQIRMTGQISSISLDSFTIEHANGTTDVTFDKMSAENVRRLEEADIIQPGSYVVVEGRLAEGPLNRAVIEADNIYVQGRQ